MRACSSSRRFLALEGFFELVHRGCDVSRRTAAIAVRYLPRVRAVSCGGSGATFRRTLQDLHQVEIAGGLFLEALHHGFEHVERFALVLDQRIVLAVAAQPDAFLQVVHVAQVVFPLRIEHAQHDHALVVAHGVGADQLFLRVVTFFQLGEDGVAEFLPAQRLRA